MAGSCQWHMAVLYSKVIFRPAQIFSKTKNLPLQRLLLLGFCERAPSQLEVAYSVKYNGFIEQYSV
jgi:hypothetical protein